MSLLSGILPKKHELNYILILGVEAHHIRAIVCTFSSGKSEIIGSGQSDFSADLDETEAADIAISMAEKGVPEGLLVEKVIFALPTQFVEGERVKPEYLTRLKKITKTLNLKPFGFVEYQSAIAYYFESEEGSALSAILLSVDAHQLIFTLLRLGKIQKTVVVNRTPAIGDDLTQAITDLNVDILPSRIILYDESQELESFKEELLKFSWHKQSAFLHTPKIEILSQETIIAALTTAAGSSLPSVTPPIEDLPDQKQEHEISAKKVVSQPHDTTAPFGFENVDSLPPKDHMKEHANITLPPKPSPVPKIAKAIPSVDEIKKRLQGLRSIPIPFPRLSLNRTFIVVGAAVLVGLIAAFGVSLSGSFGKAKVKILVLAQIVSATQQVKFTQTSSQTSDSILIESVSAQVSGDKTSSTTGKTQIGEKAKGELIVYNKSTGAKTLPKGAILGYNNLQFTLDDTIQIASASDTGEGLTFGKLAARVTASTIGPEGNIPANATLTFKDYPDSSVNAKTTQAFSGGSAREVGSVSKEDQNELLKQLTQELSTKLKQEITIKLAAGQKLLEPSFETKVVSRKYSAEVGSEAKSLSLSLTLSATAFSYKENDLLTLPKSNITAPAGFDSDPTKTRITVESIKEEKDGSFAAVVRVYSYFIPQLDKLTILQNIAGKSYDGVATYLQTVGRVAGVRITQIQSLPFQAKQLPKQKNNIELVVSGY